MKDPDYRPQTGVPSGRPTRAGAGWFRILAVLQTLGDLSAIGFDLNRRIEVG